MCVIGYLLVESVRSQLFDLAYFNYKGRWWGGDGRWLHKGEIYAFLIQSTIFALTN